MNVLLHPTTQKRLALITHDMPQSLLLSGDKGVGLYTIAKYLAGTQIAAALRPQNAKDQTDDENGTISVEMIRQLYAQTRAKHTTRQLIIIDDADRMTHSAQAAFLKLLEEPNSQIYFILTSHSPQRLLDTIRSRVQQTLIHPILPQQTIEHLQTLGVIDPTKHTQLQFIAGGQPAELTRLATDDDYFTKRAGIMSDARLFLQATTYEKLLVVQRYQSDRAAALQLVDSAMQIIRRTLSNKPQPALINQLAILLDTRDNIANQYNIRLQLAHIVV